MLAVDTELLFGVMLEKYMRSTATIIMHKSSCSRR